jgi:hypothetical protein
MQKKEKHTTEEKNTEARELWLDNATINEVSSNTADDMEKTSEEEEEQ